MTEYQTTYLKSDSVVVTEAIRDTTVVIPEDVSSVQMQLECDSDGNIKTRELLSYTGGSKLKPPAITIKDNILTAKAISEREDITIPIKSRSEVHANSNILQEKEFIEVEVSRLTWWQKCWIAAGKLLTIAVIIFTAYKLIRLWIRTKK